MATGFPWLPILASNRFWSPFDLSAHFDITDNSALMVPKWWIFFFFKSVASWTIQQENETKLILTLLGVRAKVTEPKITLRSLLCRSTVNIFLRNVNYHHIFKVRFSFKFNSFTEHFKWSFNLTYLYVLAFHTSFRNM